MMRRNHIQTINSMKWCYFFEIFQRYLSMLLLHAREYLLLLVTRYEMITNSPVISHLNFCTMPHKLFAGGCEVGHKCLEEYFGP